MGDVYKKIIRKKDKKIFYILNDEFLCSENHRVLKSLSEVKDFKGRFRPIINGYDDIDTNKELNSKFYDGSDNYKVWEK